MNEFSENVYAAVRRIPKGKVANYGTVAFLAGKSHAARGVGFILNRCRESDSVPCHRVVFKDGSLCAGYVFGGQDIQRDMLVSEGVTFLPDGRVDMVACSWCGEE